MIGRYRQQGFQGLSKSCGVVLVAVSTVILFARLSRAADEAAPPQEAKSNQGIVATQAEQWGMIEVELPGPSDGNPFVDIQFNAEFTCDGKPQTVTGFYDGNACYRVRFMPVNANFKCNSFEN